MLTYTSGPHCLLHLHIHLFSLQDLLMSLCLTKIFYPKLIEKDAGNVKLISTLNLGGLRC